MKPKKRAPRGTVQYKRRGQTYQLRWTYAGKPYYLSPGIPFTPAGERAAKALAAVIQADLAADIISPGTFDRTKKKYMPQPSREVLSSVEIFERFIQEKSKTVSAKTIGLGYASVLKRLQKFASPIETREAAESFLAATMDRLDAATHRRYLGFCHRAWEMAVREQLADINPFDGIARPRGTKDREKRRPFTDDEVDRILAQAEAKDGGKGRTYDCIFAFLGLGTRPSELCGLRWGAVDMDSRIVTIREQLVRGERRRYSKTHQIRTVTISEDFLERLKLKRPENPDPEELVFLSPRGKHLRDDSIYRQWVSVLKMAGVPHRPPYTTRHTVNSRLAASGVTAADRAEILGHGVRVNLDTYTHSLGNSIEMPEVSPSPSNK